MVLAGQHFACVRITGRANCTLAIDYQALVNQLDQKGYTYVVMDLSECLLMDSTFLGILTGFGLKMNRPNGTPHRAVELLNPNARVAELLDNMGVLHLFKVQHGEHASPETVEPLHPDAQPASEDDVTRVCLQAHQALMALSPENAARFKDVAHFLAEKLKKDGEE
jgi:anti-sigma B factor antagonist